MITTKGFDDLIKICKKVSDSDAMVFFVELDFKNTKQCIESANYYLSETREEDDEMDEQDDKYKSWLDYSTFLAILDNKLEHHPKSTKEDLLEAVIYYLQEDDFLD